MLIILLFLTLVLAGHTDSFSPWLGLDNALHNACIETFSASPSSRFQEALVCGRNLPTEELSTALRALGLIHVVVVSGMQINALRGLVCFFIPRWRIRGPVFALLSTALLLVTLGSPPVVRAFTQSLISWFNRKWSLFWTIEDIALLSGAISFLWCLVFARSFLSAQLSLLCALSMCLSATIFSRFFPTGLLRWIGTQFISSFITYIAILPLVLGFGATSPWTIAINAFAAPLFGFPIYYLALLQGLCGVLHLKLFFQMIDWIISCLTHSLIWTNSVFKLDVTADETLSEFVLNCYFAIASWILWLLCKRWKWFSAFSIAWLVSQSAGAQNLIVWNVGQGSWATLIEPEKCLHFDMGGETMHRFTDVQKICKSLKNQIIISHDDVDHFSFLRRFLKQNDACFLSAPERILRQYPDHPCKENRKGKPTIVEPYSSKRIKDQAVTKGLSDNDRSTIVLHSRILAPGDSTKKAENIWARDYAAELKLTRVLILGHHGSYTSTGKYLLQKLPFLRLAIASARRARYGHPHPSVLLALKKKGVPVLTTENWGNIQIETKTNGKPYPR